MSYSGLRIEVLENDSDSLKFKKHVILGYTDVCAAGSRALMGICMRVEYRDLNVRGIGYCPPACARTIELDPKEEQFLSLQVLNCKYEEYTLVVVNTILPGKMVHLVTDEIMRLCKESMCETLTILSSLYLDIPLRGEHEMFENCLNDAKKAVANPPCYRPKTKLRKVTTCRHLPGNTPICDPFLSTLLQMVEIDGIPTNVLLAAGYRTMSDKANYEDGSKQIILGFHKALSTVTGLQFDTDLSTSLVYKERTPEIAQMTSSIYV